MCTSTYIVLEVEEVLQKRGSKERLFFSFLFSFNTIDDRSVESESTTATGTTGVVYMK
jgi:hypothetical protein